VRAGARGLPVLVSGRLYPARGESISAAPPTLFTACWSGRWAGSRRARALRAWPRFLPFVPSWSEIGCGRPPCSAPFVLVDGHAVGQSVAAGRAQRAQPVSRPLVPSKWEIRFGRSSCVGPCMWGYKRLEMSTGKPCAPARSHVHSKLRCLSAMSGSLLCARLRAGVRGLPVLVSGHLYPARGGSISSAPPALFTACWAGRLAGSCRARAARWALVPGLCSKLVGNRLWQAPMWCPVCVG
jgi:hypothetical protein